MARLSEAGTARICRVGVCDGSGWILGPEDVARPCECRTEMVARARLRGVASVIPAKYRGVSFDRPPVTQIDPAVVRKVRDYTDKLSQNLSEGRGLWFVGGSGTGKTTLAMLVSRLALESSRAVAIYSLPKMLARVRATYDAGAGEQSYQELFGRLTSVDLLHIDDLGVENRTEWVLEQLYALINERYETKRSLIVTTNYEENELAQQVGERLVSRLSEMCDLVPLYGTDQRVQDQSWHDRPPSAGVAGSLGESTGIGVGPLDA